MKKKTTPRVAARPALLPPRLVEPSKEPAHQPDKDTKLAGSRVEAGLFCLFLLTLLTPLIYNSTTFFGFITGRTVYFRALVVLMTGVALFDRRLVTQPFSPLQVSIVLFGLVLALANAFGVDPVNSFLSDYSRMEGFLGYCHYSLYFLVLARAGFSSHRWRLALLVAVVVAVVVVVYGAAQASGWQTDHFRLVATIGNPSYLGLYLLLSLWLAVYLTGQFRGVGRWTKITLLVGSAGPLLWGLAMSGTRSALLGGGVGLVVLGIGWAGVRFGRSTRTMLVGMLLLLLLSSGIAGLWRVAVTNESSSLQWLSRFSAGSNTFRPRYLNWKMALAGIADRPLLGWGQENYSYGFARYYDPALLLDGPEPYDRPHNLLLEVGFAAGVPGLLAYGFIWFCLLRQLRKNPLFTTADRVTLLALLAAYLAFNLLNFDSLVSAQVFFMVLALLDTQPRQSVSSPDSVGAGVLAGKRLVGLGCAVVLGFYTMSAWQTTRQVDRQSRAATPRQRAQWINTAYEQARVGQADVAMVQTALATAMLPAATVSADDKRICYELAVVAATREHRNHPASGLLTDRLATLYATRPDLNRAAALYDTLLRTDAARQPRLWFLAGVVNLKNERPEYARRQFREALRRQPDWQVPRLYEALTYAVRNDTAHTRAVMRGVKTPVLADNQALVRSIYLVNRDTTGLLSRLDRIPYDQRSHLPVAFFQAWALLAFEAGRSDQVTSALRSFMHSDGIWINETTMNAFIDRAKHGTRPERIDRLIGH